MASLAQLLSIPQLSTITILNSKADLTKQVDSVDISETPDVVAYLSINTLLITTGMAFKDNQLELCKLIEELSEFSSSGLCIKLGRYIDKLEDCVIETADKLKFPLLRIPSSMTLGTTCHQMLSYIWDIQTEKLHYALCIQREFNDMLIHDSSLTSLVHHLSKILKQDVFLINPFMDVVATSFNINKSNPNISKVIGEILNHSKFKLNSFEGCYLEIEISYSKSISIFVSPVKVNTFFNYILIVLESDKIHYPFSQLVIEQASTVLAFILYKNQKLEEINLNLKEEFFYKLIRQYDKPNISQIIETGKKYGLLDVSTYRVIIVGIDEMPELPSIRPIDVYLITYEWLQKKIDGLFINALIFPMYKKQKICIVLQSSEENLEQSLKELSNDLKDYFSISISFAIGNEVSQLASIYFSFIEAEEVYLQWQKLHEKQFVKSYISKGILELLQFIPNEHVQHFCKHTLKTLAYPTNKIQLELRKTLQVYLDCQGEISETSKVLFIHRNTVKYRISKLNEIFDTPIEDSEISLQLRVALLLSE
jgi:PucR family transcriptional regulator, purine catabolism regulatory protein